MHASLRALGVWTGLPIGMMKHEHEHTAACGAARPYSIAFRGLDASRLLGASQANRDEKAGAAEQLRKVTCSECRVLLDSAVEQRLDRPRPRRKKKAT